MVARASHESQGLQACPSNPEHRCRTPGQTGNLLEGRLEPRQEQCCDATEPAVNQDWWHLADDVSLRHCRGEFKNPNKCQVSGEQVETESRTVLGSPGCRSEPMGLDVGQVQRSWESFPARGSSPERMLGWSFVFLFFLLSFVVFVFWF